jgi:hypothetical protein
MGWEILWAYQGCQSGEPVLAAGMMSHQ